MESTENIPAKRKSHAGRRPPVIKEFPTLVQTAAEFIKLHGFSAHFRRRESVGTGKGVSVDDERQHFLETVPGIRIEASVGQQSHTYFVFLTKGVRVVNIIRGSFRPDYLARKIMRERKL